MSGSTSHVSSELLFFKAQPKLNSTSTQTKAEVSFILKQIQPAFQPPPRTPNHPTDQTVSERRLKCPLISFRQLQNYFKTFYRLDKTL